MIGIVRRRDRGRYRGEERREQSAKWALGSEHALLFGAF